MIVALGGTVLLLGVGTSAAVAPYSEGLERDFRDPPPSKRALSASTQTTSRDESGSAGPDVLLLDKAGRACPLWRQRGEEG